MELGFVSTFFFSINFDALVDQISYNNTRSCQAFGRIGCFAVFTCVCYAEARLSYRLDVCPSVRPSVRLFSMDSIVCSGDDWRHQSTWSSSSRPCWQQEHGWVSARRVETENAARCGSVGVRRSMTEQWPWHVSMTSGIDIYSQLLISAIRISDITIWNYWYHQFELLISIIRINDITNSCCQAFDRIGCFAVFAVHLLF